MIILSFNCGSSSVKYQLYNWDKKEIIAKGIVEASHHWRFFLCP